MSDYIDRQVALDALGVTKNATKLSLITALILGTVKVACSAMGR